MESRGVDVERVMPIVDAMSGCGSPSSMVLGASLRGFLCSVCQPSEDGSDAAADVDVEGFETGAR